MTQYLSGRLLTKTGDDCKLPRLEHRAHQEAAKAITFKAITFKAITFKEATAALIENMRPGWKQ